MIGPLEPVGSSRSDIEKLLFTMKKNKATEMRLASGGGAFFRISEKWHEVGNRALDDKDMRAILGGLPFPGAAEAVFSGQVVEARFALPDIGDFAVRAFLQDGKPTLTAMNA